MSKKSILAMVMVVLLPVTAYYLVKYLSESSVNMPRRYFFDNVKDTVVNGKKRSDTIWHSISNFSFPNQLNDTVYADDVKGKILVVDFFFTRCPNPCPIMTRNMKKMQDAYKKNDTLIHFISFSVDPARDSVETLKRYADRFGAKHNNWWFLTGEKQRIYDLAFNEFKAAVVDGGEVDTAFLHTNKFYLLDKNRVIRGWYDGTDSVSLRKMARDISLLILEKDKTKKRNLFRK
jgi:protein SCO1/2